MHRVPLIIEPDADDPDFATVKVDATIAGRPYRLLLDTGAARTQLNADPYTSSLVPVGNDSSSATFGGSVAEPIVTVTDLAIGPVRIAALDVIRSDRGLGQMLGLDVLREHRCHFRLEARFLELDSDTPNGISAEHELTLGR